MIYYPVRIYPTGQFWTAEVVDIPEARHEGDQPEDALDWIQRDLRGALIARFLKGERQPSASAIGFAQIAVASPFMWITI